jgi:hypothetical protein
VLKIKQNKSRSKAALLVLRVAFVQGALAVLAVDAAFAAGGTASGLTADAEDKGDVMRGTLAEATGADALVTIADAGF